MAPATVFRIQRNVRATTPTTHVWSLRMRDDAGPSVVLFDRFVDARRVAVALEMYERCEGRTPSHANEIEAVFATYFDPACAKATDDATGIHVERVPLVDTTRWALARNIGLFRVSSILAQIHNDMRASYTVASSTVEVTERDDAVLRAAVVDDFAWQIK